MVRWQVPPSRRFAFVLVLAVMASSVVVSLAGQWRVGGYVLASSLALAAVLRATLPDKYCLGLLVRGRRMDTIVAALFAVAIAVTASVVPAGPGV